MNKYKPNKLRELLKKEEVSFQEYKESVIEDIDTINPLVTDSFLLDKFEKFMSIKKNLIKSKKGYSFLRNDKKEKLYRLSFLDLGYHSQMTNLQYWLDRGYDLDESTKKLKYRQGTLNKEVIISKYSMTEKQAETRIKTITSKIQESILKRDDLDEINHKKGISCRFEYYLDKVNPNTGTLYTIEEAKIEISNKFRQMSKKAILSRLPEIETTRIEYWLKKYDSYEDAINSLYNRQHTFSLKKCIDKYGEIEGKARWEKRQIKWKDSLKSKSDDEKNDILLRKLVRSNFYSKSAVLFFKELIEKFEEKYGITLTYFYGDNEYFINYDKSKLFFYDFLVKELNLIIEYNGEHVHANPILSEEEKKNWKHAYTKENFDLVYKKDKIKREIAEKKGFSVITVWMKDLSNMKIRNDKLNFLVDHMYNRYDAHRKRNYHS